MNDSIKIEKIKIEKNLILNNEVYTDKSDLWSLGILKKY